MVASKAVKLLLESSVEGDSSVLEFDTTLVESDIKDGKLYEILLGETKQSCIVSKVDGELCCVSNKCTHVGANLANGSRCGTRVRCPFHGACFNLKSGDIEDYPGLDSLHKFDVRIDSDSNHVIISVKSEQLKSTRRLQQQCISDSNLQFGSDKHIVIIGGGPSAQTCLERMKQLGFSGCLTVLSEEVYRPYDRTKLSKSMTSVGEDLVLRSNDQFYESLNVNLKLNHRAVAIDVEKRCVEVVTPSASTSDASEWINYDYLVIATGCRPRTFLDDARLSDRFVYSNSFHVEKSIVQLIPNIFYLRTPDHANGVMRHLETKAGAEGDDVGNIVIFGSSFIAMECAAYLASHKLRGSREVVVVGSGRSKVPFERFFGPEVGSYWKTLHESKGVKFMMETSVKEFIIGQGCRRLKQLKFEDNSCLNVSILIAGIGVIPNTSTFIPSEDITLSRSSYVSVNHNMMTSVSNIYACGDVIEYPLNLFENEYSSDSMKRVSIGHYQLSHAMGRCVAENISSHIQGRPSTPFQSVPFFWSQMFGKSIRFAGFASGSPSEQQNSDFYATSRIVFHKDKHPTLEDPKFIAYFVNQRDIITGIATLMFDPVCAAFANRIYAANGRHCEDSEGEVRIKFLTLDEVSKCPEWWID